MASEAPPVTGNSRGPSRVEHPVIGPGHTFATVTDKISSLVLTTKTPIGWFVGFGIAFLLLQLFLGTVTLLLAKGIGIWGVNVPVGWGFDIINFVWWIGIGHAGTLISAILLLLRQQWRTSINRFAEAMTLFAVACAGMFPILHMGRPWVGAYWLMPYPNTMGLWPNFRSPLIWDVFAVSTYATVSALFWFVGLIPDLATLRDRAQNRVVKTIYGMLALGWRGSARHWAQLRDGLPHPGRPLDPARRLRPHRGELRLRGGRHPRLARHRLPALLRGRRHLRRLRHGADPRHPAAQGLRPRGLHHHEAHREHGQGHARDLPRGGLRLPDGGLHGLVQRQHLRALHDVEPGDRAATPGATGCSSSATWS